MKAKHIGMDLAGKWWDSPHFPTNTRGSGRFSYDSGNFDFLQVYKSNGGWTEGEARARNGLHPKKGKVFNESTERTSSIVFFLLRVEEWGFEGTQGR